MHATPEQKGLQLSHCEIGTVSQYLRSKNWDTRVAAAHAIGAIAGNVKHTTLTELYSCAETKMSGAGISGIVEDVVAWPNFGSKIVVSSSFRSFDINEDLEFGALLASGGQKKLEIAMPDIDGQLLLGLDTIFEVDGLDMCEQFMDVNDMIRHEDLIEHKFNSHGNGPFSDPIPDEDNFEHDGDGCWPFHNYVEQLIVDMFVPVWEVCHGSVMALREILTHQGACAGVYMLDLSSDDPFSETKDKGREIDLNMQVLADEIEPNLKWPKVEDSSSPLMVTSTIIFASGDDKFDACVKAEDSERNLSAAATNGELNFSFVKIEPQSCIDGHEDPDMAKAKGSCEDNCSIGKMNTLKSLPENCVLMNLVKNLSAAATNGELNLSFVKIEPQSCIDGHEDPDMFKAKGSCEDNCSIGKMNTLKSLPENCVLMNLVKVTRRSWLKNCEFLQDCDSFLVCIVTRPSHCLYCNKEDIYDLTVSSALIVSSSFFSVDQNGKFDMGVFWVSNIWLLCNRYNFVICNIFANPKSALIPAMLSSCYAN
ncbi:hypothetical protein TEA_016012 [Camellia sinensis var. sinensis]|uniref:Uncharacterized protein n=1 Tax=Camellia sinensis var. sinensis TaxID=542762 RepID=A0A4S4DJT8_CAMSN|nr:hypothetical protein TEA_016012 [Camellia sinensis var. sinensis]